MHFERLKKSIGLQLFSAGLLTALGCASATSDSSCGGPTEVSYGDPGFNVQVSRLTKLFQQDSTADSQKSVKSVVILPPTGGENFIDRSYSKQFCKAGYDVYIIKEWTGMNEEASDLALHDRLYGRGQKAIELVLAEIKTPYIGLLGTSVGALHGAVAASMQDRLNAVFVIAGGAPITEIIVQSDQDAMKKLKKLRYEKYSFKNDEEYGSALIAAFHFEPMMLGDGWKKKTLGMSLALKDKTVPVAQQKKLSDFWNPKVTMTRKNAHFWEIVSTWANDSDEVLGFFEDDYKNKNTK